MAAIWLLSLATAARADDWPQWMGPQRDNVWREAGVMDRFPPGGPAVRWRTPVAGGYAGPAVTGGRVYLMDYVTAENVKVDNFDRKTFTGVERVLCLDEQSGELKWKHEYPVVYGISYPAGPRCTPTVDGGRVYALGAEGNLTCLDASTGAVAWSKDFHADYNAKTALWGYASHPLVDGNNLICVVGGEGSHCVAFDKVTGAERWRSLSAPEQGYSPPTIIEAGGARQLLLLRPGALSAVDPESGQEYWSHPYEATSGSIIMSPVRAGDYLYVGGYNNKSLLLNLARDEPAAQIVWRDRGPSAISPVNVQPLADDGVLYGFDQKGVLRAVELPDGHKLWETSQPVSERPAYSGTALFVRQQDRVWMFVETGDLVIGRVSRAGFEELDRAHVIQPTNNAFGRDVVWSMPAFANRRAYIRNDQECICVDLSAK
ncbi:MAG: PQQ-like beta-propeller repeat protein [Pirellulales bacterium]|nr:PQQ-like beta-propeller repeat protein [Pirellulales bacterium]